MTELNQEQFDKIVKKVNKSKYQNCTQCEYFLKDISKSIGNVSKQISRYYWNRENIEVIIFRCRYLNKRVSFAVKPFKDNNCLCFK